MSLNIGKFTGYTSNGSKIYQKIEDGVRVITTVKNNQVANEIRLKKLNGELQGYRVNVKDTNSGNIHAYSDITDFGFAEQYRTIKKSTIEKDGTIKNFAVTKSADGDSVEIAKSQQRPDGEEFYLTNNYRKNADGKTIIENEFETSNLGWTKPDGTYINGFHQSVQTVQNGKTINQEIFGNIDALPKLSELA